MNTREGWTHIRTEKRTTHANTHSIHTHTHTKPTHQTKPPTHTDARWIRVNGSFLINAKWAIFLAMSWRENKLFSMKWWWFPFQLEFYSTSWLKQHSMGRHISPHGHIILQISNKYKSLVWSVSNTRYGIHVEARTLTITPPMQWLN